MATIYERVRKVTISQLEVSEHQVSAASSFVNELGADSLDLVELIMALEEEFTTPDRRVSIPDEDVEKIVTVQDAVEYLRKLGVSDHQVPPKPVSKPGFKVSLPQIHGQQNLVSNSSESKRHNPATISNETKTIGNAPRKRRRNRSYTGYDHQNPRQGGVNQPKGRSNMPKSNTSQHNPPPTI